MLGSAREGFGEVIQPLDKARQVRAQIRQADAAEHEHTFAVDSPTQSFVVMLWMELPDEGSNFSSWRGHITHVLSGQRHYLEKFKDIEGFISPYLG